MAYQALYRKYRSQRFDEMVGQEVVATTLKNAIVNHQISHAYLFSGPRGTGKTSAAKIFAKAINCPNQVDGEPCNNCFICDSITKGSLDDVIELDAASNNGVDEIREIRDKSTYAASQATYKVYIIDEVHMLSTGAFNALLKTLEEPTENVVFVLATTELQKIPATIISRVQRFAFKSITTGDIRTYLAKIMADEGLEFDGKALDVIAKAAEGGMRDALSLLDQALSFSSGKLEENDALLVTGSIAADALVTYVAALFEHDEAKAMTELDKIFAEGKNMLRFTEDLLAYLRDLLLDKNSQYDRGQIFSWIDVAIENLKTIKETTQTKIAADVMTMRLAEIGQNNLLTASQGEIPNQLTAEIATLKTEINQLKAQISAGQIQVNSDSQNNLLTENVKASPKPIASKKRQINKDLIYKALAEATNEARKAALSAWPELVASVTKPADRALLNNTAPVAASENFLVVTFPHENLAKRVSENEELQLFCGNLLSSIVGFAPEIISLAEQDWQEVRAEYVSNLKSENVQEDEEDEKEPDETVNLAKELFGEKVVEIND
ncbi:DNA polymerase III subunit gamma/tau [Lactococcus lactis]|uniref:DNA polymerase III subunit gamma/tau n=1 Tax=Lactococcus lactis TaxID=1358 RepID=UPI0025A0E0DB|nr:DNA polymerase III subunit gamma/tau [Lactococcus lactis]MDM7519478.1 DNA polymerase III subunit gamma/tau [Lactococcus lactis]